MNTPHKWTNARGDAADDTCNCKAKPIHAAVQRLCELYEALAALRKAGVVEGQSTQHQHPPAQVVLAVSGTTSRR